MKTTWARTARVGSWRFFGLVSLWRCGFFVIRHRRTPANCRGVLALGLGLVYAEVNWGRP